MLGGWNDMFVDNYSHTKKMKSLNATYLWEIDDFRTKSSLTPLAGSTKCESNVFNVHNIKWQLDLYPNGDRDESRNTVVVYLKMLTQDPYFLGSVQVTIKYFILPLAENVPHFDCPSYVATFSGHNTVKQMHLINHAELLAPEKQLLPYNQLRLVFYFACGLVVFDDAEIRLTALTRQMSILEDRGNYEAFFNSENLSDIQLVVGDNKFHAHKIVLAKHSQVFEAMFRHNTKENLDSTVIIEDLEAHVVLEMLRFMYTGKVNELQKVAHGLLIAADKYAVQFLKDHCCKFLVSDFRADNVIQYLTFAENYNVNELKEKAVKFISANSADICKLIMK